VTHDNVASIADEGRKQIATGYWIKQRQNAA
jgi:hypothetical protein